MRQVLRLTLDTTVWWDWLKRSLRSYAATEQILAWHADGTVIVHASSRVRDPDLGRGAGTMWKRLEPELKARRIELDGAPFRIGVSRISGPDPLSGCATDRTPADLALFREKVGPDPSLLNRCQVGRKMLNKVGDYDALRTHYARGRDVFITLDTKGYFATEHRTRYRSELTLVIQSPEEFVGPNSRSRSAAGRA